MSVPPSSSTIVHGPPPTAEQGRASRAAAAAVAAAEAIAAGAAAEVAAEAASTAQAAVNVAYAAAGRAAAKATDVAAQAVLAAAMATDTAPGHLPRTEQLALADGTAAAAAKVALCVAAVAEAASKAVVEAAAVVGQQLATDIAAAAMAVAFAVHHPALSGAASTVTDRPAAASAGGLTLAPPAPAQGLGRAERLLASELRVGTATEQLRLHYQPIMHLASGQVVGVEALVRWQHPARGLLGPQAFIELAEQTGLVLPLGAWVIREACQMAASLPAGAGAPLTVAVNLSGRQLSDRGLVDTVRSALQAAGCTADRLVFEVTETALVTDMAAAVDSLRELQQLGVGVAIDDFGTGYAPLTYLKQLAADDLKIDRSFVCGLGSDAYDTAIVASLITLAHNLNVRCVAEGVETVEQLILLEQLGCDFAQGYLFARPMDPALLGGWLDRHAPADGADSPPAFPVSPETPRIVAMHQHGVSRPNIAASLNLDGSRTDRGQLWSASSVAQTLGDVSR